MSAILLLERTEPDGRKSELYGNDIGDKEIYIDGAWGITTSTALCKVNLFTTALAFEENIERRQVAVRLVMPISTLFSMRDFFVNQCEKIDEAIESLEASGQLEVIKLAEAGKLEAAIAKAKPKPKARRPKKPATRKKRKKK